MTFSWQPFLITLAVTAVGTLALFGVVFAVAVRRNLHRLADNVWGPGFGLIAVISLVLGFVLPDRPGGDAIRIVACALTVIWGIRLGVHIGRRNAGKGEDPRYEELMEKAPGNPQAFAFRKIYLTQAGVQWFVSLPVQAAMFQRGSFGWFAGIGVIVWLIGFAFEAIGDQQLVSFKANAANKGKVLDSGLWRYTRHPNYFGDATVWWGLYLIACGHWIGALTFLSAGAMTLTLVKGTGAATLERGMAKKRPGYADYVKRTSGFFPLPPKGKSS